jgi:cytochrome P450
VTDHRTLLENLDIYDPATPGHLHDTLRFARERCPVARSEMHGGYYLVTRYDDVATVLHNDPTFSSAHGKSIPHRQGVAMPPIDLDPPMHGAFRRLLNPYFTKAALSRHEDAIRDMCNQNIDGWIARGQFDAVSEFASPFTAAVLARVILDIEDLDEIAVAQQRVEAIGQANAADAWVALQRYVEQLLEQRAKSAVSDDDVLGALATGEVDGRPLTDDERVGVVMVLMAGGLDTTKGALASIIQHMTEIPGLEARVRDPAWTRTDLDEFLRLDSPVTCLARFVTGDVDLGGQHLHEGDWVLVHYMSANRDEQIFAASETLDFDRTRNPHVAFGLGIHRCLGSNLARLELSLGFEVLLGRIHDLALAEGTELQYAPGVTWHPLELPVTFDVSS